MARLHVKVALLLAGESEGTGKLSAGPRPTLSRLAILQRAAGRVRLCDEGSRFLVRVCVCDPSAQEGFPKYTLKWLFLGERTVKHEAIHKNAQLRRMRK